MKGVPQEQVDMVMELIDHKPDLFKKIAEEIDARMKKGEHQMYATMEVMKKYRAELGEVMQAHPGLFQKMQGR